MQNAMHEMTKSKCVFCVCVCVLCVTLIAIVFHLYVFDYTRMNIRDLCKKCKCIIYNTYTYADCGCGDQIAQKYNLIAK